MANVMILHSSLGRRPSLVRLAERLGDAGHRVDVPDFYDGKVFDSTPEGLAYRDEMGWREQKRRVQEAIEVFAAQDIVLVGFSLGAALAQTFAMSRDDVAAAVMVGAGGLPEGKEWKRACIAEMHHMSGDPFVEAGQPGNMITSVAKVGGQGALFTYPGEGHLFMDEDLPDFDAAQAELFHARLDALLARV